MLIMFLITLMTAGFSYLYYFLGTTFGNLSIWFLFLWVFLGLISALLVHLFTVFMIIIIGSHTKPDSKFKHFCLGRVVALFTFLYGIRIKTEGKENIPEGTFVVYSNHKSMMDPVMLYLAMGRICTAIGKKDLVKHWLLDKVFKCFGALPIDRENDREAAKTIVQAIKMVKNGLPMIIFPEGGIKSRETDEMVNLRAGAYKVAMKANAPVLPCAIIGNSAIAKKKFFQHVTVKFVFFPAIYPEDYKDMNTTELGTKVEEMINAGIRDEEGK